MKADRKERADQTLWALLRAAWFITHLFLPVTPCGC